jgi:murein L,D-transpeptidase YcbB/YkuD
MTRLFRNACFVLVCQSLCLLAPAATAQLEPAATSAIGSAPTWLRDGQLKPSARAILDEMRSAERYGLRSGDYHASALIYRTLNLTTRAADTVTTATLDADIGAAVTKFITHLHSGRVPPRAVGHDLDVPHAELDTATALQALAVTQDTPAVLADYEPSFHHYRLLRTALQRYRELAQEPELTQLPALPRKSVRYGEPYAGMPQLRTLLAAFGDLDLASVVYAPNAAVVLDPASSAALRGFQTRHGLDVDGMLGPATFAALTEPFEQRVRKIELALERSRWLPPALATPPIIVNIPQFKLFAFRTPEDREADLLIMNVVVGKIFPENNTPVFAADLRTVVLRPYWDVPRSILSKELLPQIRRSPAWVTRNGFEIVQGAGDDADAVEPNEATVAALARGELRLRQKPGPRNALGSVKFLFPNRYNVYLHDTPAQGLFSQARRAASHGCVRVADPPALIAHVLRNDPNWTADRVRNAMAGSTPTRIALREPIRVFLMYATAIAIEDGRVLFFEDIYGHDAKLQRALDLRAR